MNNLWSISGNLCKKTKRMKKILVFMLTFVLAATASTPTPTTTPSAAEQS
jgi:hypothetical protein